MNAIEIQKGIKRVNKYQTSDDKLFDNANEAHNHEIGIKISGIIRGVYHSSSKTNRLDSFLQEVLMDPKPIRDALTWYIQSTRKVPTEKEND